MAIPNRKPSHSRLTWIRRLKEESKCTTSKCMCVVTYECIWMAADSPCNHLLQSTSIQSMPIAMPMTSFTELNRTAQQSRLTGNKTFITLQLMEFEMLAHKISAVDRSCSFYHRYNCSRTSWSRLDVDVVVDMDEAVGNGSANLAKSREKLS